ncbi:hypothetical protein ACOMHN_037004 [Nucella lapillus]
MASVMRAYHRTLNDAIRTRHPNLWSFIRQLKDHQTLTEEAIFRAERGDAPPPRRRKWRELEETLQTSATVQWGRERHSELLACRKPLHCELCVAGQVVQ